MKLQISLSKSLPPLESFLSQDSLNLLRAWHGQYINGKKPNPLMFTQKAFKQVRKEFKAAGLWKPPEKTLYRGFSLTAEDFLSWMRGRPLLPRTEVVSWTTNRGTAAEYSRGMTAKLLTFSVIIKQSVNASNILTDLRDDVQRQIERADKNYEIVLAGTPIPSSMVDVVSVSKGAKTKARKEALSALRELHAEGTLADVPDPDFLSYNINAKGHLIEGV